MEANKIFQRLLNGETIPSSDPEAYKMREASFLTKKLLVQMNNASNPDEIRNLLSQITGSKIDESVAVFTNFGMLAVVDIQRRKNGNTFVNF